MDKKVQLNTFDNQNFNGGAGKFKRILWHFTNGIFFKSFFHFYSLKVGILRCFGATVGRNVVIKPYVNIKYPWNIVIGNDVWIGEEVWIDSLDKVIIGNDVCISQGALLLCGNHNYHKTSFDLMVGKIILEDGVWIGAKSVVCANVICHSHSVLGVLGVATRNLEQYTIYRGNPAEPVKKRTVE